MRTEQLANLLDNSERGRMITHIGKSSGTRFLLNHTADVFRSQAKRDNLPGLEKFAVRLEEMSEELKLLGL